MDEFEKDMELEENQESEVFAEENFAEEDFTEEDLQSLQSPAQR